MALILLDPKHLIIWYWRQSTKLQIAMAQWENVFICAICQAIVLDFLEKVHKGGLPPYEVIASNLNDPVYGVVAKPEVYNDISFPKSG